MCDRPIMAGRARKSPSPRTATSVPELGLRERKAAATRLAIVRTLHERLGAMPLTEISVDDLARDANVSRMTFFNYFPTKEHAVDLLMMVWLLEIERDLARRGLRGTRAIERVFELFGDEVAGAPARMKRVLAIDEAVHDHEIELVGTTYELAHFLGALANGAALVGHGSPDTDWRALYRRHGKRALGKLIPGATDLGRPPKTPQQYRTPSKRRGTRA